ncbi:MAG: 50S ribosomal protein L25, partial [Planctomycetaceae bacterium]|nr:50S ribosomal protein L25 [Planctomycetaceae bacterium]
GLSEGGVIEHVLHELDIECPAAAVPEKLVINVNELRLGKAIHAKEVPLPPGAKVLGDEDALVVHCIAPHVDGEETPTAAIAEPGAAEPELIRKEKTAEEEAAE